MDDKKKLTDGMNVMDRVFVDRDVPQLDIGRLIGIVSGLTDLIVMRATYDGRPVTVVVSKMTKGEALRMANELLTELDHPGGDTRQVEEARRRLAEVERQFRGRNLDDMIAIQPLAIIYDQGMEPYMDVIRGEGDVKPTVGFRPTKEYVH